MATRTKVDVRPVSTLMISVNYAPSKWRLVVDQFLQVSLITPLICIFNCMWLTGRYSEARKKGVQFSWNETCTDNYSFLCVRPKKTWTNWYKWVIVCLQLQHRRLTHQWIWPWNVSQVIVPCRTATAQRMAPSSQGLLILRRLVKNISSFKKIYWWGILVTH